MHGNFLSHGPRARSLACALLLGASVLAIAACGGGSNAVGGGYAPVDGGTGGGGGGGATAGFTLYPGTGNGTADFLVIDKVQINDSRQVVVDFSLSDDGTPLALSNIGGNARFVFGWIEEQGLNTTTGAMQTRYQSYIVDEVDGAEYEWPEDSGIMVPPVLATSTEASYVRTDRNGTVEDLGGGQYRFTSDLVLPAGFDAGATHTLSGQAVFSSGGESRVANPVVHFVPAGGPVTVLREVVATETCNECHHDLALHGGSRKEVGYCVLCHTDQTFDPESGETVNFKTMIHRIHYGAGVAPKLPGGEYKIVGHNQSVHDYSDVVFPYDVINCDKCHKNAPQADNWKLLPSKEACTTCHADIDPIAGVGHLTVAASSCSLCHAPGTGSPSDQFSISIDGAHTSHYHNAFNPGLTLAITAVTNFVGGGTPTVSFTLEDKNGTPVDLTGLQLVTMRFAGPTEDYFNLNQDWGFTVKGFGPPAGVLTTNAVGDYTFVPNKALPMTLDGSPPIGEPPYDIGTWAIGMEARYAPAEIFPGGPEEEWGANNAVTYVDTADGTLGGGSPMPRRTIVDEAKCQACHDDVRLHGQLRTDLDYCVMCHNGWGNDEPYRAAWNRSPSIDILPASPISLPYMVHKIHMGHNLTQPYWIVGFSAFSLYQYETFAYPGDIERCDKCHVDGSHELPAGGVSPLVYNDDGIPLDPSYVPLGANMIGPTVAACTACHDSEEVLTHALLNTWPSLITDPYAPIGEGCAICHGPGAPFEPHK